MLAAGLETPGALAKRCGEGMTAKEAAGYLASETATMPALIAFRLARCLNVGVAWLIGGYGTVPFHASGMEALALLNQMTEAQVRKFLARGRSIIRNG